MTQHKAKICPHDGADCPVTRLEDELEAAHAQMRTMLAQLAGALVTCRHPSHDAEPGDDWWGKPCPDCDHTEHPGWVSREGPKWWEKRST